MRQYFGSYDPMNVRDELHRFRTGEFPGGFLMMYFGLPALLILPPTLLMGFTFPVLQRIVQTDFSRLGRRIGLLMVANIAGSVVGTILTGWLALDLLGTAGTLKAIAVVSTVFALTATLLMRNVRTRLAGDRPWWSCWPQRCSGSSPMRPVSGRVSTGQPPRA